MQKGWLVGKNPDGGKDWRQEEKGSTEDEMVGWHHQLNGHEFEWTLGVGDGQGGLACCDSWGRKESDMAEQLNWTEAICTITTFDFLKVFFFFNVKHLKNLYWICYNISSVFCKIKPVSPKGNQSWIFIERTDAEAETPILWPPDAKSWLTGKDPDAGKEWRQEEKGSTEDEMVGWHHQLNGHEFEQTLGVGDGQGNPGSPWGRRESDTTEHLKWTELLFYVLVF